MGDVVWGGVLSSGAVVEFQVCLEFGVNQCDQNGEKKHFNGLTLWSVDDPHCQVDVPHVSSFEHLPQK